jgi:LacI family transcriptional regulator
LRQAFVEHGLKTAEYWWQCPPVGTEINGHDAMRRLWELPTRPDGLVITDDVLATGAIIALLELGVRIPGDLFVVTFSNKGAYRLFPQSLVQLQMDVDAWVARAAQMLFDRLEGRRLPRRRVPLPFTLIETSDTARKGVNA